MIYGIILVVIIILIVLAAVFNPSILMQIDNTLKQYAEPYVEQYTSSESAIMKPVGVTRDIARTADISALQGALLEYRLEHEAYPKNLDILVPDYMAENPKDPKTNQPYDYKTIKDGKSYSICVTFESKDKPDTCISPQ